MHENSASNKKKNRLKFIFIYLFYCFYRNIYVIGTVLECYGFNYKNNSKWALAYRFGLSSDEMWTVTSQCRLKTFQSS